MQTILQESFAAIKAQAPATREFLTRLQSLSPKTASLFDCKADQLEEFVFRLIFPNSQQTPDPTSYLALSYCWQKDTILSPRDSSRHPLPIPPLLFAALTKELKSDLEGIWCDQICIDQDDNEEKALSIGMMDMVYREARRTVVALADIEISEEEQACLESYLKITSAMNLNKIPWEIPHSYQNPPYMNSNPVLHDLYWKIIGSKSFQRAWCAHELRLGRQQNFLAACQNKRTVLRLTAPFIAHLVFLASEVLFHQQPARLVTAAQHNSACNNLWKAVFDRQKFNDYLDSDYLGTYIEINEFGCGGDPNPKFSLEQRAQSALRDRMVVNLNTNDSGLIFTKAISNIAASNAAKYIFTDENCFKTLSILSLASRDPLILCTTGKPISCDSSQPLNSWFKWSSHMDIRTVRNSARLEMEDLQQIRIDENDAFLELELSDFGGSEIDGPLLGMKKQAAILIVAMTCSSRPRRNSEYIWERSGDKGGVFAEKLICTLACLLQCGISWILHTLSFSEGSFLSRDVAQTSLRPLQENPPQWLQTISTNELREEEMESLEADMSAWIETDEGWQAAQSLLEFTAYIAVMSLPIPEHVDLRLFQPLILSRDKGKKHIVLLNHQHENFTATAPKALFEDRFDYLNRMWFLEIVESDGDVQYHLAGRQRIFGPSIADLADGQSSQRLRVYGPRALNTTV